MDILVLGSTPVIRVETPPILGVAPLEFAEGRLINATVQHSINSLVWLEVGGQTLIARTEIPLQAQQRVSLEVVEADAERVTFRVVG